MRMTQRTENWVAHEAGAAVNVAPDAVASTSADVAASDIGGQGVTWQVPPCLKGTQAALKDCAAELEGL